MGSRKPKRKLEGKKLGLARWLSLLALLLAIHWYPVRFGSLRLLLLVGVVTLWVGALFLVWHRPFMKRSLLAFSLLLSAFSLWPARAPHSQTLRQEYVNALKQYDGTTYIWGGENKRGIDCSGLMRCGLIEANLRQAFTTANPFALRAALSLWWNDCFAKALGEEFQGRTRLLFTAPAINSIAASALHPGHFAVTADGIHVLAYLGEQNWIEADPNATRVVQVKPPTNNIWFDMPVHVMRWRQLE